METQHDTAHRTGEVTSPCRRRRRTARGRRGRDRAAHARLRVRQHRVRLHRRPRGGVEDVEAFGTPELADPWLGLFNTATLPFYWGSYEPQRGEPDEDRLRRTAQWFQDRGVTVKGHPLLWHTITPSWLPGCRSTRWSTCSAAAAAATSGFAGLIDVWDAINEP